MNNRLRKHQDSVIYTLMCSFLEKIIINNHLTCKQEAHFCHSIHNFSIFCVSNATVSLTLSPVSVNISAFSAGNMLLSLLLHFLLYFQGLWFSETASLWMLPCMNKELEGSLTKRGISNVQQLLNLPKATLQGVIDNFPASRLYQVWIAL